MADDITIVDRLRSEARAHADGDWNDQIIRRRFTQAADEIEQLRAERDAERALADQLADALRDEARNHELRGGAHDALGAYREARRG